MAINIWVEKYRPKTLEDLVGNKVLKEKLASFIKEQEIPNILLSGHFGTGKTSIGKILTKLIDADVLYINAVDENNVDVVRVKIKDFIQTVSLNKWKIVFLDEFHRFSMPAQQMLRNVVETYSNSTRFIITTNYLEKIDGAMISRFQTFTVEPPNKLEVIKRLIYILEQEHITYNNEDLAKIVNQYYPDIRNIIQTVQQNILNNVLQLEGTSLMVTDFMKNVVDILKAGTNSTSMFQEIRKLVADNKVRDFQKLHDYIYSSLDLVTNNTYKQFLIIVALADSQYRESFVVNKEINFMSAIVQIINIKLEK